MRHLSVRQVKLPGFTRLSRLMNSAFAHTGVTFIRADHARLRGYLADDRCRCWAACGPRGALCAFAIAYLAEDGTGCIDLFAVPEATGPGAERMLACVERYLGRRGAHSIRVGCLPFMRWTAVGLGSPRCLFFLDHGYRNRAYSLNPQPYMVNAAVQRFRVPPRVRQWQKALAREGVTFGRPIAKHKRSAADFAETCFGEEAVRKSDNPFRKYWPNYRAQILKALEQGPPYPIFCAFDRDTVIGYVGPIRAGEGRGGFGHPYVMPAYRGRKIGVVLFNLCVDLLRRWGAEVIPLSTGSENTAQEIYAGAGFTYRFLGGGSLQKNLRRC
ncbi:MAG: GNAT family N-acetyltransferase [Kiritimatiellae bacterium]|nr:GNAT family N-acetyltransferase [Kiritimatiellia bacterium]